MADYWLTERRFSDEFEFRRSLKSIEHETEKNYIENEMNRESEEDRIFAECEIERKKTVSATQKKGITLRYEKTVRLE